MKFVLVNGRSLCRQSCCVKCKQAIGTSYLREVGTHLIYCDHTCYADHCETVVQLLESHARSVVNALGGMTAFSSISCTNEQ